MAGYIELYNLGKTYETPKGPAVIVEGFNLNLAKGEIVALLGHSGCGKSTFIRIVAGLDDANGGQILLDGHPVSGPGPDRGRRSASTGIPCPPSTAIPACAAPEPAGTASRPGTESRPSP